MVAIHAILHKHQVYPSRMFSAHRKYNLTTFRSKHPMLNDYIHRTITSLRPWLLCGKVETVTIPVFEIDSQKTVARYVYDVKITSMESGEDVNARDLGELDVQLRAHLARLVTERVDVDGTTGELAWDLVVRTGGVECGSDWVAADGVERREITEAVAIPLKDPKHGYRGVVISSRVEVRDMDE